MYLTGRKPRCIQQNCLVPFVLGVPTFLVLAVTGLGQDEEASFSHVTLLGADGETLQQVQLNSSSSSSYSMEELVGWVDSVPKVPFTLRLTGQDNRGNKLERVSTEMVQPTHINMQVVLMLLVMNCPLLLLLIMYVIVIIIIMYPSKILPYIVNHFSIMCFKLKLILHKQGSFFHLTWQFPLSL